MSPPACRSPRHAGATGVMLVSAAKKKVYFGEKTSFAIHLVLCRHSSGADKMFIQLALRHQLVTAWLQRLAQGISQCHSHRDA